MSENYMDAALRHWRDAELLKTQNVVENADSLYGIAAEVAVKLDAGGGSAEPQQADFATVGRAVDAIKVQKVDVPDCDVIVKDQTPGP